MEQGDRLLFGDVMSTTTTNVSSIKQGLPLPRPAPWSAAAAAAVTFYTVRCGVASPVTHWDPPRPVVGDE